MNGAGYCPTGKLERLLLATDRSEFSEGAIREAINFAGKCKSKLYAMTVIELFTEHETLGGDVYKMEEKEAKDYMDALVARAKAAGVDCEAVVRFGDNPHALIVDEAHDKGVDMIIMGRRGSKGLMKFLMGVVASRVIGYAPCDVLIVPRAAKIEYSNILVATDGSVHAAAAVKKAVDIAKRCGGGILAVSAMRDDSGRDEAEKYANEAADISRKEGVPVETATPIGRPYDMIVETAGGRGVGLIVIGTYGRSGLSRMLMGSTTERVIGLAGCGVLVVK